MTISVVQEQIESGKVQVSQGCGDRSGPPAQCCKGPNQPTELQLRTRLGLQGVHDKCLCAEGD